jgi:hypothetical protein
MIKKFENYEDNDFYNEENWEDEQCFDYNLEEIMQDIQGSYVEKLNIIKTWLEKNFIVEGVRIYNNNELYFEFHYNNMFRKKKGGYGTFTWEMKEHPLTMKLTLTINGISGHILTNNKYLWRNILIEEKVPVKD